MDAPYELGDSTSQATQLDKTPNLPLPLSTAVALLKLLASALALWNRALWLLTRALEVMTSALALLA